MTTLEFRARVPDMCGGRDGIVAEMRRIFATEPITKAGSRARLTDKTIDEYLRACFAKALAARLYGPLSQLLNDHFEGIILEHELMFGRQPVEAAAAATWSLALNEALLASLAGETTWVETELRKIVFGPTPVADLTRAITTAPIQDYDRAFAAFSISAADLDALRHEIRNPESVGAGAEGDSDDEAAQLAALFGEPVPAGVSTEPADVTDNRSRLGHKRIRRANVGGEADAVSEAAAGVLETILEHTGLSEVKLAEALRVSRSQMNNWRRLAAPWRPTKAEMRVLAVICDAPARALDAAMAELERARQIAEEAQL